MLARTCDTTREIAWEIRIHSPFHFSTDFWHSSSLNKCSPYNNARARCSLMRLDMHTTQITRDMMHKKTSPSTSSLTPASFHTFSHLLQPVSHAEHCAWWSSSWRRWLKRNRWRSGNHRVLQTIGFTKTNNSDKWALDYLEVLAVCHTFGHRRQLLITWYEHKHMTK